MTTLPIIPIFFDNNKIVDDFIDKYNKSVSSKLSTQRILVDIIEFVEHLSDVKNKQELAIMIFNRIIYKLNIPAEDEDIIKDNINIIIQLTKGEFNINKAVKTYVPNILRCLLVCNKHV